MQGLSGLIRLVSLFISNAIWYILMLFLSHIVVIWLDVLASDYYDSNLQGHIGLMLVPQKLWFNKPKWIFQPTITHPLYWNPHPLKTVASLLSRLEIPFGKGLTSLYCHYIIWMFIADLDLMIQQLRTNHKISDR